MNLENLKVMDKDIYDLIMKELDRQNNGIELIASENFVSEQIMEAMGSVTWMKMAKWIAMDSFAPWKGNCEAIPFVN